MPKSVDLSKLLNGLREDIRQNLFVCTVGRAVNPDNSKGKVDVEVLVGNYPKIPNVKVLQPGSKGFVVRFPIEEGDVGLVIFLDWNIDNWVVSGRKDEEEVQPHNISNAIFIPGLFSDPDQTGELATEDKMVVGPQPLHIEMNGQEIKLGQGATDFVALASLVKAELDKIQAIFDAHSHPSAVGPTGPPASPIGSISPIKSNKVKSE